MVSINRMNKTIIVLISIISGILLFLFFYLAVQLRTPKIHKRIYVGDTDVSGLTKDQALQKVNLKLTKNSLESIVFIHENKEWQIPFEKIEAKYNIEDAVDKAYSIGRNGNIFKRVIDITQNRNVKNYELVFNYNRTSLLDILKDIKKQVDIPKKDARIVASSNGGVVIPHFYGKQVDLNKAFELADASIKKLDSQKLELPVSLETPKILDTDLKGMSQELSAFQTTFNLADVPRTQNIKLACSKIDGLVLRPSEQFSMDKVLLQRTVQNGYKKAKAYLDGEIVEEIGGGVCQVTTTLYNATLLANLKILERHPHTMMVGYVNPGMDATVSDKGIDFKFSNSYNNPIYLYSLVNGNKIDIRVFGKNDDLSTKIEFESEVTQILYPETEQVIKDKNLKSGVRVVEYTSKNGYRANLYKKVYKDNILVSRELVSQNIYRPLRGKIRIGI